MKNERFYSIIALFLAVLLWLLYTYYRLLLYFSIAGIILVIFSYLYQSKKGEDKSEEDVIILAQSLHSSLLSLSNDIDLFHQELSTKHSFDLSSSNPKEEAIELINAYNETYSNLSKQNASIKVPYTLKFRLTSIEKDQKTISPDLKIPTYDDIFSLKDKINRKLTDLDFNIDAISKDLMNDALIRFRIITLEQLLPKISRIKLDEFATLLEFDDVKLLKHWIFELPSDYPLVIENDDLIVNRDKLQTSEDVSDAINQMLEKFDLMEKEQIGKKDN